LTRELTSIRAVSSSHLSCRISTASTFNRWTASGSSTPLWLIRKSRSPSSHRDHVTRMKCRPRRHLSAEIIRTPIPFKALCIFMASGFLLFINSSMPLPVNRASLPAAPSACRLMLLTDPAFPTEVMTVSGAGLGVLPCVMLPDPQDTKVPVLMRRDELNPEPNAAIPFFLLRSLLHSLPEFSPCNFSASYYRAAPIRSASQSPPH